MIRFVGILLIFFINFGFVLKFTVSDITPVELAKQQVSTLQLLRNIDLSKYENLPLKIIQNASQDASNNSCMALLKKFTRETELLHPNALKNSWGKVESGIWDGNVVWEGRYHQCLDSNFAENVSGKYCLVEAALPTDIATETTIFSALSIAICLPETCSEANVSSLFVSSAPNYVERVSCISPSSEWNATDIASISIVSFLALLVVLSTYYDYASKHNITFCHTIEYRKLDDTSDLPALQHHQPVSDACRLALTSFSVLQNTKRLLDTTQRTTDITCLHGIRFLSISWVMLGHIFSDTVISDNLRFLARYAVQHYEFQVIMNAYFSVDSFFFLSGLLVVYLGMKQLCRREGKMNVPFMYLYRYLRLTPAYAFLILVSIGIFTKFGDGPFWLSTVQPQTSACEKYWYTNLLYFNNLYDISSPTTQCWTWGWYLANDFQFFLLSPLFLWLLYKNRKVGIGLIAFFLLASMTITGAFSSYTKQQPPAMEFGLLAKSAADLINGSNAAVNNDISNYSPYVYNLYDMPWCRIGAYLVGMLTGYILHASGNKMRMSKITVVLGWVTAFIINFLLVYACYPSYSKGEAWSVNLAAFYNAVSRPVWCMGLAWVTIACVSGYGGPVNSLLSWKVFIPLSRLTYCIYLIHPLVLQWFTGSMEVQQHISIYMKVTQFLFLLLMTAMLAYLVAVLIEFPVTALLKILQEKVTRNLPPPPFANFNDENFHLAND